MKDQIGLVMIGIGTGAAITELVMHLGRLASGGRGLLLDAAEAMERGIQRGDTESILRRVRKQIGAHTRQPDAVRVEVNEGVVTLRGQVQRDEIKDLISAVEALPNVRRVIDQLDAIYTRTLN